MVLRVWKDDIGWTMDDQSMIEWCMPWYGMRLSTVTGGTERWHMLLSSCLTPIPPFLYSSSLKHLQDRWMVFGMLFGDTVQSTLSR